MSLGLTPTQQSILGSTVQFCDETLAPNSIYRYLYDHAATLFPDESFADLFQTRGRCSIPPQIVAVVMILQRLEGLSDREAVDRFAYDMRWKYAAGGLEFTHPGFVHTVLVFSARENGPACARENGPTCKLASIVPCARQNGPVDISAEIGRIETPVAHTLVIV